MNKTPYFKNLLIAVSLLSLAASAADCGIINPVTGAISDIGAIVTAPAHIDRASLCQVVGVVGAGLALYSLDGQIRHLASKNQTKGLNDISKQAEKLGNGGYDLAIAGAGALAGYAFSDQKLTNNLHPGGGILPGCQRRGHGGQIHSGPLAPLYRRR